MMLTLPMRGTGGNAADTRQLQRSECNARGKTGQAGQQWKNTKEDSKTP